MIYAEMVDRVSGSWRRLESIRICWGYKYLAPSPQGAPRRPMEALNGISWLHPPRYIDRVALGGGTLSQESVIHLTQYEGVDSMPRSGIPTFVMKAKVDLPVHLPHPSLPRHTPERRVKAPRIDQQGQPCIILPLEDLRRLERQ